MARTRSCVDNATNSLTSSCSSVKCRETMNKCHICTGKHSERRNRGSEVVTVFQLIPDGFLCDGGVGIRQDAHPSRCHPPPPHAHCI